MINEEQNTMETPGPASGNRKSRVKKLLLIAAAILLIALIAITATGSILFNRLGDAEKTVETLSQEELDAILGTTVPTETTPEDTWPVVVSDENITNIMLVGQNWREDEQNKLSDTMILCSINRETKTLSMISFLRDLYVPLPAYAGHGPGANRINTCYALGSTWKRSSLGGMEMLAKCVEQNFGIPVHHTIEVTFETFTNIIDMMGGVEVDVTQEEADYMSGSVGYVGEIQPGKQTLNGTEALAYARIRAIDGDRQRTARQRGMISSLLGKCRELSLMDMLSMAYNIMPFIITDMEGYELGNYVWELLPMVKDLKIQTVTCPVDNELLPGSYWGKELVLYGYPSSVLQCNTTTNGKYLREFIGMEEQEQ